MAERRSYDSQEEREIVSARPHSDTPDADVDRDSRSDYSSAQEKVAPVGTLSPGRDDKDLPPHDEVHATEAGQGEGAELMRLLATGMPFPEVPGAPAETQFTFRALLTGCCLGGMIGAADMYLGLKSGSSQGGGAFGALAGFAIVGALSRILPMIQGSEPGVRGEPNPGWGVKLRRFFKMGGRFGPKENVTIMCTATAAASNGTIFYSVIPALYRTGLLKTPKEDIGRLILLSLVCAYWGMFFAPPFRKVYILDQKLPFPSAAATSIVIRTLHATNEGADAGKRRVRVLLTAFLSALVFRVVSVYAVGILWSHHLAYAFYLAGWKGIIKAESWTWYMQWSPAFLGFGMILGPNITGSILLGQISAWGIIGPALVASGRAVGQKGLFPTVPEFVYYMDLTPSDTAPSPRYWLIWPGLLVIVIATFAELFTHAPAMFRGIKYSVQASIHRRRRARLNNANSAVGDKTLQKEEELAEWVWDPAPKNERVPTSTWLTGAIIAGAVSVIVLTVQFDQHVGISFLAILLALLFAFIAVESTGRLAINLTGAAGNLTQFIFIGVSKAQGFDPMKSITANSFGAALTMAAGQQTADMLQDLKAAHLLNANPKIQFWAQVIGAVPAVFISPAVFILFTDAYPCIISTEPTVQAGCTYSAPSAAAFQVGASLGVTGFQIPKSSGIFAIVFSIFAGAMIFVKNLWVPARLHVYIPNFIAIGLGMVLPAAYYGLTFVTGCIALEIWKRRAPHSAVLFAFPVAAGLIAGEGIGGLVTAILQMSGVGGSDKGTTLGCPGRMAALCG